METKKCVDCNAVFPKTNDFFFKKNIKQKLANGNIVVYNSLRSNCKKCHADKHTLKNRLKRCQELGISLYEYSKYKKEHYNEGKIIFKITNDAPVKSKTAIYNSIRKGYNYINYDQYRKDLRSIQSRKRRKYDYGEVDFVPKNLQCKSGITNLTDSYIALTLNSKVNELPTEIIQTKRLTIQIQRELKKQKLCQSQLMK